MTPANVLACFYLAGLAFTWPFMAWWMWMYPPATNMPLTWWERLVLSFGMGAFWPLVWTDGELIRAMGRDRFAARRDR